MKKSESMRIILVIILVSTFISGRTQKHSLHLGFRISGQEDYQREVFATGGFFGSIPSLHKTSAFNYGIDILAFKKNTKATVTFFAGAGYFRNKFNFTKTYDHRLLNPDTDSLLPVTSTSNYVYSLLRLPLGIDLKIKTLKNNRVIGLSFENLFNFSFAQTYNGARPFPDANIKMRKFKFYGYNFLIRGNLMQLLNNKTGTFALSPYLRLFNLYNHNDPVLYKDEFGYFIRWIDAVGLSAQYFFELKK